MNCKYFFVRLWIFVLTSMSLFSCTSYESEELISEQRLTRGENELMWKSYSPSQAISLADKALGRVSNKLNIRKIQPVMLNQKNLLPSLISDTIAYIVNYGDNDGFVVIANDNRISEPLAYSDKGNITNDKNSPLKYLFFNKIEKYLADYKAPMSSSSANVTVRHYIIDPQIEIGLGPWYPFNQLISKYHPNAVASLGCVAGAGIISALREDFYYHNYHYNFKSINFAYNNNLEFIPHDPGEINSNIDLHYEFLYSYQGSIGAYNQLLYNLGEDANVDYGTEGDGKIHIEYTPPFTLKTLLQSLEFDTTDYITNQRLAPIIDYLNRGYILAMFGKGYMYDSNGDEISNIFTKGFYTWAVDGCDIIIDANGEIKDGMIHCVWGIFGEGDGFFSAPVIVGEAPNKLYGIGYFGVK
ncbi:MAG: hypothetical protein HDR84_00320 [Bacteroides sp.]|nr:hypothetical protein [Bacteroides sp.]